MLQSHMFVIAEDFVAHTDIMLLFVNHQRFAGIDFSVLGNKIIIDAREMWVGVG